MALCPNGHTVPDWVKFCPECGAKLGKGLECPHCHVVVAPNQAFCQECGRRLGVSVSEVVTAESEEIPPPPGHGLTIEFPYSSSQTFEFAVAEATKHPSYTQFREAKRAIYRLTCSRDQVDSVLPLVEHLKGWRRRTVYVDGEKTPWKAVFSFRWCYENKQTSYRPEYYCFGYDQEYQFNTWGCIHADMPFREHAPWFCWGQFLNRRGDWQFDKDRIRHELRKNLHRYRFCPAFDVERSLYVLDMFPEKVSPRKDRNWKFVEEWGDEALPGTLLVTRTEHGYRQTVILKGVAPHGYGAVKQILRSLNLRLPTG